MTKPIERLQARLESLRQRIDAIEKASKLRTLQGDLYGNVWKKLLPKLNDHDWDSNITIGVVIKTARNIVKDHGRRKTKRRLHTSDSLETLPSNRQDRPDRLCERRELCRAIDEVVKELPEDRQTLIRNRYWSCDPPCRPMTTAERLRLHRTYQQLRNDPRVKAFLEY